MLPSTNKVCSWWIEVSLYLKSEDLCAESLPALNHLDYQSDRQRTPLRTGVVEGTIPSGFPVFESLFLDVPGTATDQVRTCGLRRNSSSLEKAPKICGSVRLNSFESFLVTLRSISSETWEMYFWAISGSSVFFDWLFLVFSGVSIKTATNFLLFLEAAMMLREVLSVVRTELEFYF